MPLYYYQSANAPDLNIVITYLAIFYFSCCYCQNILMPFDELGARHTPFSRRVLFRLRREAISAMRRLAGMMRRGIIRDDGQLR